MIRLLVKHVCVIFASQMAHVLACKTYGLVLMLNSLNTVLAIGIRIM